MKLNLEYEHGLPIERCTPAVVVAKVTRLVTDTQTIREEAPGRDNYLERVTEARVEDADGRCYYLHFKIGDVTPKRLGQRIRGVVVTNQWGTMVFVPTHMLKD